MRGISVGGGAQLSPSVRNAAGVFRHARARAQFIEDEGMIIMTGNDRLQTVRGRLGGHKVTTRKNRMGHRPGAGFAHRRHPVEMHTEPVFADQTQERTRQLQSDHHRRNTVVLYQAFHLVASFQGFAAIALREGRARIDRGDGVGIRADDNAILHAEGRHRPESPARPGQGDLARLDGEGLDQRCYLTFLPASAT